MLYPPCSFYTKTQDKAWLQRNGFGVLKANYLATITGCVHLLGNASQNKFKITEHLILLGFYQLAFSRVSQLRRYLKPSIASTPCMFEAMRGLVNGILRNFIRNDYKQQKP